MKLSGLSQLYTSVIAAFAAINAHAQPRPAPAAYLNTAPINYVRTVEAMKPTADPNGIGYSSTLQEARIISQYSDGLGRPLQSVIKQGSLVTGNGAVDMISAVEYDAVGRESFKYLPFAANSAGGNTSTNDGLFKLNPFQQQVAFYNSQLNGQAGETNVGSSLLNWAYSQTVFETSPLNRPVRALAPGSSWIGATAGGRGVDQQYLVNATADGVRIWTVADVAGDFGTYASSAIYQAGELYKNVTLDEAGKQVVEYKDKRGQLILKKVQIANAPGVDHTGWLCTYYVYDDLSRLRAVIQPKAVEARAAASSWILSANELAELCFRYEYDGKGRMTMKKTPGAATVIIIYDQRDRVVMTQDGNLRTLQKWMVTQYDNANRSVATYLISDPSNYNNPSFHRGPADASIMYPNVGSYSNELLGQTFYDGYGWLSGEGNPFTASFDNSYASYYLAASTASYPYAVTPSQMNFPLAGMVTGTKIKVLGTSTYLYSISFYDARGRVIQTQSKNITSGIDVVTTQYSFSGQPLLTVQKQEKAGTGAQTTVVVTQITYDDLGRVIKVQKRLKNTNVGGNAMSALKTVVQNEYDALGQLKTRKVGTDPNITSNPLETVGYDYNIRGWMLGANRTSLAANGSSVPRFSFELGYDKQANSSGSNFTLPQFNGNISGMIWKSAGDGIRRKYDYSYDNANRLLQALFTQNNDGSSVWNSQALNFDVKMGDGTNYNSAYDANGNIRKMQQWGFKDLANTQIDNLTYSYQINLSGADVTNKLYRVTDAGNNTNSKLGDFKDGANAGDDYSYDVNGNLTADNNKAISSIAYNHLNLPSTITITGKGTIQYVYDAAGNKLQKITTDNTISPTKVTTTLYLGGFVYENDVLQFLSHEEGRIRFRSSDNSFQWDYFLKDHLGNVRMVLTEEQKQDQYPAATLEGSTTAGALSMVNYEKQFYTIDNTKIVAKTSVPGFTSSNDYQNNNGNPPPNSSYPSNYTVNSTAISQNLYKLNGASNKTGLGIVLKVMAGDKIDIHGKSYYTGTQTYNNTNSTLMVLADIVGAFVGAPDNSAVATKGVTSAGMQGVNAGLIPSTFFRGSNGESTTVPKAYINYMFFDEQFKYAGGNFSRVGTSGAVKNHWFSDAQLQNIVVPKNGYLYVYVTNESNTDVFFDNLQIFHTHGPIAEETHYYPFGLTMAGISSSALKLNFADNKIKFQGQELANREFSDRTGLEMYEFKCRMHDPQIGRFWQVDPLADKYVYNSTYAFSENKVTRHVELEGLEAYLSPTIYENDGMQGMRKAAGEILNFISNGAGKLLGALFAPFNMMGSTHAAGNAKDPVQKERLEKEAKGYAAETLINYGGGAIFGKGSRLLMGDLSSESVWGLNALERGLVIEKKLGGNLPANFPTIDKFTDGIATSIKSIDLTADTYNKGNNLLNTLKGYINKLDNFTQGNFAGVEIRQGSIQGKALEVAIQPGKATLNQWEQISQAMKYAKDNNIDFNLSFVK